MQKFEFLILRSFQVKTNFSPSLHNNWTTELSSFVFWILALFLSSRLCFVFGVHNGLDKELTKCKWIQR